MKIQPVTPTQKISRQNKINTIPLKTQYREETEMQAINEAMLGVGLIAEAIILGCIFALVSYWVSPWFVVGIIALGGAIIAIIKYFEED